MLDTYTIHDTPSVTRRIERDLERVKAELKQHDPGLVSLVLTGGFARGEGAVLDDQPQNDYDFVVFRRLRATNRSYADMRKTLEHELGLHIDLAPIPVWRIPLLNRSIFWYETALRGRVLLGPNLLPRIRTRRFQDVDRTEALRLLVNRAAGLVLAMNTDDDHLRRIQSSKGLLAAADAHLFARGLFPPSQTERYHLLRNMMPTNGSTPPEFSWIEWAYRFKVDPGNARPTDAHEAWHESARQILAAVPIALTIAGYESLKQYMHHDGLLDHLVYVARARRVPGLRRIALNPTGRVRVGTLQLLEAALKGELSEEVGTRCLGSLSRNTREPIRTLDALRAATLQ